MRRLLAALVLSAGPVLALSATPAIAAAAPTDVGQGSDTLVVTVGVNGQQINDQTVRIDPDQPVPLLITAANNGQTAVHVHTIRFAGAVLGLSFFGFDTVVPFDVPPHESATRTLVLKLGELRGEAIGLVPASVELLDEGGNTLGDVATVTDVRGSIVSLYGALGLVLLVFAAAAWASAVRAAAVRERPESRGRRIARFLPAGIGTGLLVVVWLSVFRLVAPNLVPALGIVLGGVVVGLIAASLERRADEDDLDDEPLTTVIDHAVGVRTGVLDPAPDKRAANEDEDDDVRHSGNLDGLDDLDEDQPDDADEDDADDDVRGKVREESTESA